MLDPVFAVNTTESDKQMEVESIVEIEAVNGMCTSMMIVFDVNVLQEVVTVQV